MPLSTAFAAEQLAPGPAVTTDALNLRAGPSLQARVLLVMPEGAEVRITGPARNGFYPLRYLQLRGWASGEFLSPASESRLQPGPAYTTDAVNLRAGPGSDYDIVKVVPPERQVTVTGFPDSGYYPVRFHRYRGWISGEYLGAKAPPPPPPAPAFLFPWPAGLPMWYTSGPHNGAYGIGQSGVPLNTRGALDFGRGPENWPILSAAAGTVVRAGCYLPGSEGYGCMVEIDHGEGWQTLYAHMAKDPKPDAGITAGDVIPAGKLIGHAGETGHAYGIHLHWELRRGGQWNGRKWISGQQVRIDGKTVDGWTVRATPKNYQGKLTRPGDQRVSNSGCFWYEGSRCPARNDLASSNQPVDPNVLMPSPGLIPAAPDTLPVAPRGGLTGAFD